MFGLLIMGGATFAQELAATIGKSAAFAHKESPYSMGFLTALSSTLMLVVLAF